MDSRRAFANLSSLPSYASASSSRLQALYSDFSRQKHSNPQSYQANVHWWHGALQGAVHRAWLGPDRLVLHSTPALAEALRYEGIGKPLSLATVTAELSTPSSSTTPPPLIPLSAFLSAPSSIYTSASLPWRVASAVLGRPLWWALTQAGVVADQAALAERERWPRVKGEYVVLDLLELAATRVLEQQEGKGPSPKDALYTIEGFRKEFAGVMCEEEGAAMSERDVKVLLRYLERDKGAIRVERELIKFIPSDTSLAEAAITSVDHGLLELKTAVEGLHAQVDNVHHEMDERTAKASAALKAGRKPLALSYLRSRAQLSDLLSKRLSALARLEATLLDVERAVGDVQIVNAYELSGRTLREVLAHPSLQREHVEETMEALASATEDAREVDEAIRMGADPSGEVDEDEIEEELKRLVAEAGEEKEMARDEARVREMQERREREKTVEVEEVAGERVKVPVSV